MSEFVTEPEPGGLGAVVQDLGGALWVRHGPNALGLPWYRVGNMCQRRWGQLGPVEILSDGLTKATTPTPPTIVLRHESGARDMSEQETLDPVRLGRLKALEEGIVMLSRAEFLAFMAEWDYADRARRVLLDIVEAADSGDVASAIHDALFMAGLDDPPGHGGVVARKQEAGETRAGR